MLRTVFFLFVAAVVFFSPYISAETWDLANDWSDTSNPNGVWSYNGTNGQPITAHVDDWDFGTDGVNGGCCFTLPQPAWALAGWPKTGHVPFWAKVVSPALNGQDWGLNRALMHGDGSVTWTSPIDGTISISGGVWFIDPTNTRSMYWILLLNGVELSRGTLTFYDTRSSIAPFNFVEGTGGPDVLVQNVNAGDVLTLSLIKTETSPYAHFMGVDLSISSDLGIIDDLPRTIRIGEPISHQFKANAATLPLTWTIVEGSLPNGLTMNDQGLVNGTPSTLGDSSFALELLDATGKSVRISFTITVALVLPPPDISINKVATTPVPGRTLDQFIVVQNSGTSIVDKVKVTDFLDPNVTLNSMNPPGETDGVSVDEATVVLWNIERLQPGKAAILGNTVQISPTTPFGTDIGQPACNQEQLGIIAGCIDIIQNSSTSQCLKQDCLPCLNVPFLCAQGPLSLSCVSAVSACIICSKSCDLETSIATLNCLESANCSIPESEVTGPIDPNEKLVVANKFIQPDQTLVYPIHFENIGDVEAIDVFITDILDPNLDDSTLQILTPNGAYNPTTRTLKWDLLNRNLLPGETDNVLLSIKPVPDLPSGTEIRNSAEIMFEIFDPLVTPEVVNIIDTTPPECVMDTLPNQVTTEDFDISWSGTDAVGEIDTYSIFVSDNGTDYKFFLETSDPSATFNGIAGKTYDFLCAAKDTAGNVEVESLVSEATTTVTLLDTEVIYSNLGPAGEFSSINGYQIGYPFSDNQVGQSISFSFVPGNNYQLKSVDLPVSVTTPGFGSSDFIVAIYDDVSGKPNTALTFAVATAPTVAGPCCQPPESTTNIGMPGSIILKSGERYWIGLHTATAQPTDILWWWNPNDDQLQSQLWQSNTPSEVLFGGAWEINFVAAESAYQVNGILVTDGVNVSIDIKPGSDPNSINLCSNGTIPVAIFGSVDFDVSNIDTKTLRFAETTVKMVGKKDPQTLCSYEDVNDDGLDDLVCHFVTTDIAAIEGESSSATVTVNGELFDDTAFEGSDSVNIVKDTCN